MGFYCIGHTDFHCKIMIFRSPIYRWSMKLIFGGFEEDMSTIQPPNMKVVLPIHTDLSELIFFGIQWVYLMLGIHLGFPDVFVRKSGSKSLIWSYSRVSVFR